MNKQDADKHIFEYLDKIFGFSLDKMKNIERLLEKRLLEPLNDIQRKSVFSIVCLPEYK